MNIDSEKKSGYSSCSLSLFFFQAVCIRMTKKQQAKRLLMLINWRSMQKAVDAYQERFWWVIAD